MTGSTVGGLKTSSEIPYEIRNMVVKPTVLTRGVENEQLQRTVFGFSVWFSEYARMRLVAL